MCTSWFARPWEWGWRLCRTKLSRNKFKFQNEKLNEKFEKRPEKSPTKNYALFSEDGKGWGHKRGDLKTPGFLNQGSFRHFQAFFRHFSGIFRGSGAMKIAWKMIDSKIRVFSGIFQGFFRLKRAFSNPPFCAPTLCHPPIFSCLKVLPGTFSQFCIPHFQTRFQTEFQTFLHENLQAWPRWLRVEMKVFWKQSSKPFICVERKNGFTTRLFSLFLCGFSVQGMVFAGTPGQSWGLQGQGILNDFWSRGWGFWNSVRGLGAAVAKSNSFGELLPFSFPPLPEEDNPCLSCHRAQYCTPRKDALLSSQHLPKVRPFWEPPLRSHFRWFSLIVPDSRLFLENKALGKRRLSQKTADFRRNLQKTAGTRRKPQIGVCPLRFVPLSAALFPLNNLARHLLRTFWEPPTEHFRLTV